MKTLRWALVAFAVLYLLTGLVPVRPGERAVVRRFGAVVARPGPGLWIGFPWGIDDVRRVSVRQARQCAVGYDRNAGDDAPGPQPGQYLTGDQNLVNIQLILEWTLSETDADLDAYTLQADRVEPILARQAEAALAAWAAGQNVDAALLQGRFRAAAAVETQLRQQLPALQLGIILERVSVDELSPPATVRDAFEQVNQAQTLIRTRENQAQQEAAQRRREAASLAFQLQQQASAYQTEKRSAAQAEATLFERRLAQVELLRRTNPGILTAIWWDEMGQTLVR
ncbi:MAG: SPFH domain-containing protein, partial [Gemmataceae bacterium]